MTPFLNMTDDTANSVGAKYYQLQSYLQDLLAGRPPPASP
jgi:hypothetical protein